MRERWKALRCLEYLSKGGMSNALIVDLAGVQKSKWAERTVWRHLRLRCGGVQDLSNSFVEKWSPKPLGYFQGNPNLGDTKS